MENYVSNSEFHKKHKNRSYMRFISFSLQYTLQYVRSAMCLHEICLQDIQNYEFQVVFLLFFFLFLLFKHTHILFNTLYHFGHASFHRSIHFVRLIDMKNAQI